MPGLNAIPVASVATARPPQNALLRGVLGRLSLNTVRNAPSFSRCQLGRTPGVHEQKTHGHAIGYAHDVMKEAMQNASRKDAAALARTLELLSDRTNDNLGPVLLVHLTAIGAVREGVAALLRDSPSDQRLATHLKQLDDAIVKTGIKTGKCELAEPDAVYLAQYPSTEKVCDAVAAGKKVMTHCAAKIGGPALLAGIAQAVLPQAMMDSLAERLPELVDRFMQPEGAPEWSEVLQSQAAWHLNKVLKSQLESGGTEDLQSAVIQLLKTPEYILRGQRGGEGDDSDGLQRPDVPADAPAWVKQGVKDGAPILYNVVNCGGNASSGNSHRCGMQLEHVRNLLNDAREDAYERGRLTEIVRFQEHHIDRLERELQAERERNGSGEVRERRLQKEKLNNASMAATPLDEQLDPIPDRDAARFPVDVSHASIDQGDNTARNPQRQDPLNKASGSMLPPDADLDPIKPDDSVRAQARDQTGGTDRIDNTTQQRRDAVKYPSNGVVPPDGSLDRTPDQGNGAGIVRRQAGGEDQTDRSDRLSRQNLLQNGSSSVVPPGDELGDVPPLDIDLERANLERDESDRPDNAERQVQRQRVGDGQQWLRRQPAANRPSGAPVDDVALMAEYKLYLQALGVKQNPPLHDPFPTTGGRGYFLEGPFVDGGPGDNRTLSAKDFIDYRTERAKLSGIPFEPFSTGPVAAPPKLKRPELIDLIATHGPDKLAPTHVLERRQLRAAPATPVAITKPATELDLAFASMRKKRMHALYPATTPTVRAESQGTPLSQPGSKRAAEPAGMGAIASLMSFTNATSSNERRAPTRAEILTGSRAPRGEKKPLSGIDRGLEFARTAPPVGSAVAQIVKRPGSQSQSDVLDEKHLPLSRSSSSDHTASNGPLDAGVLSESALVKPGSLGSPPVPRSAHMVALEQAVQMLRLRKSADLGKTPLERGISEESRDSGNESPTQPNDGGWNAPVKRVADLEPVPLLKHQRVPKLDRSFMEVRYVEGGDAPVDAKSQKVRHVEHEELVVKPKRQRIPGEEVVTQRSTPLSDPLTPREKPFVHSAGQQGDRDALMDDLKQVLQQRAAAQEAS